MTRKDTILIAVVINAGLLAILFTTAVIYDTDGSNEQMELTTSLVDNKAPPSVEPPSTLIAAASTGDEVDNVLKYYTSPASQPIVVNSQPEVYMQEPIVVQPQAADEEESAEPGLSASQERFVEVKVKRGDTLEKIAKANKMTISALKQANQLTSEHLSIGQVLKIPAKETTTTVMQVEPKVEPKSEPKKEPQAAEPVYHVVKSGDNPWKIAKQYGVKYDEILRLNNMNEDKARNLKIGDRIRVK